MVLRYVLDEHFRRRLWKALQKHNLAGIDPVDVVRVGDLAGIPFGIDDSSLLLWAEREQRIVITRDENTMAGHLADHLNAGHHSPGVFMVHRRSNFGQVVAFLVLAAYASKPGEWEDRIEYIP